MLHLKELKFKLWKLTTNSCVLRQKTNTLQTLFAKNDFEGPRTEIFMQAN